MDSVNVSEVSQNSNRIIFLENFVVNKCYEVAGFFRAMLNYDLDLDREFLNI